NPNPTPPYYFDKIITAAQDVFHQEERHISEIRAVELWDRHTINDKLVKAFGFIAHPGKTYSWATEQYQVKLIDTIYQRECITVQIAKEGANISQKELWFIHELQNMVYNDIGCELESNLTRRIMIDRPGKNLLSAK